jgi:hypothetical protein
MIPIVNARGVPGSAGALALGANGTRYFISCSHVLYGRGATTGDRVWVRGESGSRKSWFELGRTARGFLGQISYRGHITFIDCALGRLNDESLLPPPIREAIQEMPLITGAAAAGVGARVSKRGWITGQTHGVVADVDHYDYPGFEDQAQDAPGQILIRPDGDGRNFSAPGESGCAVLESDHRVIGFLWGCNAYGEGIAFPASPALEHLGVTLECALAWRTT